MSKRKFKQAQGGNFIHPPRGRAAPHPLTKQGSRQERALLAKMRRLLGGTAR
jgi:hypothetical protein